MFLINFMMKYIKFWLLFSIYTIEIHGATHWMVTEGGLIQPKLDSPFQMARPYDLLAFLNQDTRWDNIMTLHDDLKTRQLHIRKLWSILERESNLTKLLSRDENCLKAGSLKDTDWYTTFLEDGKKAKLGKAEFSIDDMSYGKIHVPDCKKISSMTFSMGIFEHLEGMKQRENLSAKPEMLLPVNISPVMTVDEFGHWLVSALKKNSSSWLHYNLASLYWRANGNAPKAMECSRRAVHHAPREYKDVALLSMGQILHRSKMSEDAVIVLGAAADHDPEYPINHFVLANALAVLGDFNSSVKHYDACLKLSPTFFLAEKHKAGALCNNFVLQRMRNVQVTLHQLRTEIAEYTQKELHWLKKQSAFLRTLIHNEEFEYLDTEKKIDKITELTGLDIKDLKKEGDKYTMIEYFLDGPAYKENWLKESGVDAIESVYSLQTLVRHISKHSSMINNFVMQGDFLKMTDGEILNGEILQEVGPTPTFPELFPDVEENEEDMYEEVKSEPKRSVKKPPSSSNDDQMSEYDTGIILYPSTIKVSRNSEDFDTDADWPSSRLCKETAPTFPKKLEAIYQIFLPFENKGIRLTALLNDKIGVPFTTEHELPWHPPTCPIDKDATAFTQKRPQKPQFVSEVIKTDHLREKLREYVSDGHPNSVKDMMDAEIGHRIYAAMQMKLAPKWLLYTLSSLYWRVRGNNVNALHCIMTASRTVEPQFRDIVLVSLASTYLEMGYFDEALAAAEEAFKLSLYEPATNFLLAELNMIKKFRNTHMFHLKQVIRLEPNFMNGLTRTLLYGWACLFKKINVLHELELSENDICTQVDPSMSMVCDKEGANCHLTNMQCVSSHEQSSTLVRMLELKDDNIQGADVDDVNEHVFDHFVVNIETDRTDKRAHEANYDAMMKTVDKALKGCGNKGCASIQPEDLAITTEDCKNQHFELSYWLHVISFKQLLSDSESRRLPLDVLTMIPSHKKIPECRLDHSTEDFFYERFTNVDTDGWEPVIALMQQFAEIFNYYEFGTLGAKIAKYVEARPSCWAGAAAAGWWCGASGHGTCAVRCLGAAHALAPPQLAVHAARALLALLHSQNKKPDAKEVAYLSFYSQPKSKIEAFLVGVSHTYMKEYEPAVWMYRYALTFEEEFLPAKACLHATMCLMLFGEPAKKKAI